MDIKLNDPDSDFKILKSPKNKKIVGPKGEIYNSLNECSKQTGHSKKTIRRWLKDYPEKGYREL